MSIVDFKVFMSEVARFLGHEFPVLGHNVSLFQCMAFSMTFYIFMNFVRKMFGGREDV